LKKVFSLVKKLALITNENHNKYEQISISKQIQELLNSIKCNIMYLRQNVTTLVTSSSMISGLKQVIKTKF
jgi:hypothetical protein